MRRNKCAIVAVIHCIGHTCIEMGRVATHNSALKWFISWQQIIWVAIDDCGVKHEAYFCDQKYEFIIISHPMVIRGHQDLHMAANPNNAAAIEILVKCCPPGITMKVGSFVRHIVCKTPLNLWFDEVAFELIYSIIRGLVRRLCVLKNVTVQSLVAMRISSQFYL